MGRKKRGNKAAKPFCYYCDREYDNEKVLVQHQKQKHFCCETCGKRLNTAGGLVVHMTKIHYVDQSQVRFSNALEGREQHEVYGMEGVPPEMLAARMGLDPNAAPAKRMRADGGGGELAAQMAAAGAHALPPGPPGGMAPPPPGPMPGMGMGMGYGGGGFGGFPGQYAPPPPPPAFGAPAAVPLPVAALPPAPAASGMLWTDSLSMEERRAMLPRYSAHAPAPVAAAASPDRPMAPGIVARVPPGQPPPPPGLPPPPPAGPPPPLA